MLTINPIKINTIKTITFGKNDNSKAGLMSLDKNAGNKINFEKDLYITKNADPVQSNPLKAIGYNLVKAYNILTTPTRNESNNIHLAYMA